MTKRISSGAVALLLLATPLISTAQTAPSVQSQIEALLKLITQLQAQIQILQNKSAATLNTSTCVTLRRDFSHGATDATTDGEVSKLQQFLIRAGVYPEALVTGTFGPATSRALQRWQASNGIPVTTPGAASFGSKTRAAMQAKCGDVSSTISQGGTFSNFGISFMYPQDLIVKTDNFDWDSLQDGGYRANFGSDVINGAVLKTHAFALRYPCDNCAMEVSKDETAIDVTINGYTFKKIQSSAKNNPYYPDLGYIKYLYKDPVKNVVLYEFAFSYGGSNNYFANADATKTGSDKIMNSITIDPRYDHSSAYRVLLNKFPVVAALSGPTTVSVNQAGTWTAQASDPEGNAMRYIVQWGDVDVSGEIGHPLSRVSMGAAEEYSSPTFKHVYKKAGTYTIHLNVFDFDAYGGTESSSKTLTVTVK